MPHLDQKLSNYQFSEAKFRGLFATKNDLILTYRTSSFDCIRIIRIIISHTLWYFDLNFQCQNIRFLEVKELSIDRCHSKSPESPCSGCSQKFWIIFSTHSQSQKSTLMVGYTEIFRSTSYVVRGTLLSIGTLL